MLTRHLAARGSCARFTLALLFVLLVFASARAQQTATSTAGAFNLTRDALRAGESVRTDKAAWRFHAGDDAAWAASAFDDSEWRAVPGSTLDLSTLGQVGWQGAGWFRLRFTSDESLRGEAVGLSMSHSLAASEIYLDGKLIRRFGVIGEASGDDRFFNVYGTTVAITLDDGGAHVLAVRYHSPIEDPASRLARWMYEGGGGEGFNFAFIEINDTIARREQTQRSNAARVVSRASIYLAVGLLHLLLFWFYTAQRANLYFGVYAFFTAISTFAAYAQSAGGATNLYELFAYRLLTRFCFALYSTAFLMFLYSAFLSGVPRRFTRYLIPLWLTTLAAGLLFPSSRAYTIVFATMTVWYIFENLRVMTLAVRRGAEGSWIVLTGVLTALLAPLRYLYFAAGFVMPAAITPYFEFVANYGMLAAVSIYLARSFARTNHDLKTQLANVRELSAREIEHERTEAELRIKHEQERAENERRAAELEEARQLQLSMLPKRLPELPNLDIAVYMKPASEVGGDYYDFHLDGEGTLTVVIGDATGHGLKAGTVVTATKSLFNAFAAEPDIPVFFRRSSCALKGMNLRGLYMSMAMLKIGKTGTDGTRLRIGFAGMPPLLIHRRATNKVEEVAIGGAPLGSLTGFDYKQRELRLTPGDCVVLMSDGFPERFGEQGEMLGYDRAREVLASVAHLDARGVVESFVGVGDEWAGERAQDDDVTFVVLKVKG